MKKFKRVCLVEDDLTSILISKKYMEISGRVEEVLVYKNGKDAYDGLKEQFKAGEQIPEIIFLDINMPVWDGWEFLEEFLKLPVKESVKVYILTSSSLGSDKEKAEHYGLQDQFLSKPLDMSKLIKVFDSV